MYPHIFLSPTKKPLCPPKNKATPKRPAIHIPLRALRIYSVYTLCSIFPVSSPEQSDSKTSCYSILHSVVLRVNSAPSVSNLPLCPPTSKATPIHTAIQFSTQWSSVLTPRPPCPIFLCVLPRAKRIQSILPFNSPLSGPPC